MTATPISRRKASSATGRSKAPPPVPKRNCAGGGAVEVSFEIADDQALAARVVEAIFQAHSYQEPVIRIQPLLASRSKSLDDRANPNRWWNTTGDWKKKGQLVEHNA